MALELSDCAALFCQCTLQYNRAITAGNLVGTQEVGAQEVGAQEVGAQEVGTQNQCP